jgi:hypothetical protein
MNGHYGMKPTERRKYGERREEMAKWAVFFEELAKGIVERAVFFEEYQLN